jgi:hypothetical protein
VGFGSYPSAYVSVDWFLHMQNILLPVASPLLPHFPFICKCHSEVPFPKYCPSCGSLCNSTCNGLRHNNLVSRLHITNLKYRVSCSVPKQKETSYLASV